MKAIFRTTALAALLVLAGCGQPSDDSGSAPHTSSTAAPAANSRPSGTVLLDVKPQDGKMLTTVGRVVEGQGIESTGKSGQLMYGPYAAMAAGSYKVTVYGQFEGVQPAAPLILDVGYAQGASVAKSVDVRPSDTSNGVLASFEFNLPQPVNDLEVRAKVADGTHVTIKGYQVVVK